MSYKTCNTCLKGLLALGFLLVCLLSKGQANFTTVDNLLVKNKKVLGNDLVAMVYKDGKIVYQKMLGECTLKTQGPMASSSKWLTAALVMTFVDEGKLTLDERISTYIPIFETYSKGYITLRQCLANLTGIADTKGIGKLLENKKFESLQDKVNAIAKKEISANAGKAFFYGNNGYDIAARVLEVVSKKTFETLIKQRIFNPLLMSHSTFSGEADLVSPGTGALSTPADYMNFLTMILDKGMFKGKRVLSETSVAEMATIQNKNVPIKYNPPITEGFDFGLGEWIQETDSNGTSTTVCFPSMYGTWPYVDKCRGYACIIFSKNLLGDQKKEIYLQIKKAIDEEIPSTCN